MRYPKATGGEAVACPIMEPASHGKLAVYGFFLRRNNNAPNFYAGYVTKLLGAVVAAAVNVPPGKKKKSTPDTRPPLSSSFSKAQKSVEVGKLMTRYNRQGQNSSSK